MNLIEKWTKFLHIYKTLWQGLMKVKLPQKVFWDYLDYLTSPPPLPHPSAFESRKGYTLDTHRKDQRGVGS